MRSAPTQVSPRLTGASRRQVMPWTDPARILEHCTGCGDCARACPEGIVTQGRGGHPFIQFHTACTFCGACARSCAEAVFEIGRTPPWTARATISDACLELAGISCRACEDACPETALRARLQPGGTARIEVSADACTGCGACIAICPEQAIEVIGHA